MTDLLVPPLASDVRGPAFDALAARLMRLDLAPLLLYLVDQAPEGLLPLLAEQFNVVGPLWAYLPDAAAKRRALKDAVAWHRAKGSPWAVETALSWAGFSGRVEDRTGTASRWAEFQLELGAPADGEALLTVLELVRFAAPARSHLARLYGGYDRRLLRASQSGLWSDAFLSDDSGVWRDGVQLSFGRLLPLAATREESGVLSARGRRHVSRVFYPDVLRYGIFRFGDAPVLNHPVMHSRLIGLGNAQGLRNPVILAGNPPAPAWRGGWDARQWGRWMPMTPHRRIARAALALSEDARLGEPNTRFGGYAETAANRFIWSDPASRLSEFDPGRARFPIEAVQIAAHGSATVCPDQTAVVSARHARSAAWADWRGSVRLGGGLRWSDQPFSLSTGSGATYRLHGGGTSGIGPRAGAYRWLGAWDDRSWRGDSSLTHHTLNP
ncbi:phage tail protein [Chromobacterium sp. IIBBL 290-4]|uniref:phage tail protein n=1 Tax=Chromobacterium sp. IIBBL 290-4 TaxID=2953890 RepID=UPI0020B69F3F|nr:phage tail protein [Chromobacterium sp. IIBBL 290-4]UTH76097.1 phage tail protein [Chromobacterium sp. IIBBL 290-4]